LNKYERITENQQAN